LGCDGLFYVRAIHHCNCGSTGGQQIV
jgi:hypothetical protein